MSDDRSTFETTRARLEDIVVQVRRKDVSLEQSLDMLEEAVRLVNQCNDLIDQTSFRAPAVPGEGTDVADESAPAAMAGLPVSQDAESFDGDGEGEGEDASLEAVTIVETFELLELDGSDIEFVEFVAGAADEESAAEIEDDERS